MPRLCWSGIGFVWEWRDMPTTRIRAGQLRSLVRIQAGVDVVDTAGAVTLVYTDVPNNAIVWAQVLPFGSGAGEVVTAEAVRTTSMFHVTMRFRSDITEKHRLIQIHPEVVNRVLQILSVADPDGRRQRLELVCETGRSLEEE